MEITDIKMRIIEGRKPVLGYASIVLNNSFKINGIALLEFGKNRRHISMPARRIKKGEREFRDICHPINNEMREYLTKEIFEAYDNFVKENN